MFFSAVFFFWSSRACLGKQPFFKIFETVFANGVVNGLFKINFKWFCSRTDIPTLEGAVVIRLKRIL